ncbi:cyclic AMP-dependent transcription factor ATF-7-like isoform X2 [Clavelina lepadiformis]|uniref:cyclic AMP-dependent transcription factor ATF-7-like isoform X2 n=1 Tax=Clavelina lepadiformis TaxID=159417 RepID=UPI00404109BC
MSDAADPSANIENEDANERQFVCPSSGCNQKFSSPDQLAIHKQKHQMTLTLGSSKLNSLADVLPVDQTPTPTRFLHLGNQMGLFDELNPFDREFKTAQKEKRAAVAQQLQALNNKSKSPSYSVASTDGTTYSLAAPVHVIALTPTLPSPVALPTATGQFLVPPLLPSPQGLIPALQGYTATSPMQVPANLLSPTLMPFPSGYLPGMCPSMMADAQQRAAAFTHAMFAAAASASSSSATTNASAPSTISLNASEDNSVSEVPSSTMLPATSHAPLQRSRTLPAPPMVESKQEQNTSIANPSNSLSDMSHIPSIITQSVPTLLPEKNYTQSANGRSTYPSVQQQNGNDSDVSSSSISQMTDQSNPLNRATLPDLPSEFGSNSNLLDAKQKLKETLTSNNPQLHQVFANQNCAGMTTETKQAATGRKRGRQSQDIDPDIKRQRFLERNRAAASRCRTKKKIWVNGLENKAKGLSHTNITLQNEIAALKDEIASLKQLLLSHRDCPITKLQQQSMALAGINLDLTSAMSPTAVIKSEPNALDERVHPSLSNTLSNNSVQENISTGGQVASQTNLDVNRSNGPVYLSQLATTSS